MALQIISLLPNLHLDTPSNISHHVSVPCLPLTQQCRHRIAKCRSCGCLLPQSAKEKLRDSRVGYSVEWRHGGGIRAIQDAGQNGGRKFSSSNSGGVVLNCGDGEEEEGAWGIDMQDEDVQMLAKFKSLYNFVQVLEVARKADHPLAGSKILLLDKPGNIQSVYQPYKVITNSYHDLFACLPPLIPEGPIGILGLGAGTAARIIHHFWPQIDLQGWELDPAVVMVGRQFFNLSELEEGGKSLQGKSLSAFGAINPQCNEDDDDDAKCGENDGLNSEDTKQCGKLVVHIGDALAPGATVEGGFAGLIVDIFSDGAVIPALQLPETWQRLQARLRPGDQRFSFLGDVMKVLSFTTAFYPTNGGQVFTIGTRVWVGLLYPTPRDPSPPARSSTYEVCKVPFVAIGWIGVSHKQRPVCLLDPDWAQLVPGLLYVRSSSNSNGSPGEAHRRTRPLQIPASPTSQTVKGAPSSSGDNMPLDIVRTTGWKKLPKDLPSEKPKVCYAASFARYGFYGDVMKQSEALRWMGPARYAIAGFKVSMKHKSYEAEISFLDIPHNEMDPHALMPQGPWTRTSLFGKRKSSHEENKRCGLNGQLCT